MQRPSTVLLLIILAVVGGTLADSTLPSGRAGAPEAITVREPAYGLPHIYAETDLALAREVGRQVARDRLGQIILLSRVGRGTLFQAFGPLLPSTFDDDVEVRRETYTSSELNDMFAKLPAEEQALVLEYARGVNDTIDQIYAGELPMPLEVSLLQGLGLGDDLFGNATNISDQVDPYYRAPGGADPERPNGGFQFTPELAMAIAVLQTRNFGTDNFGEISRLNELNALLTKFPSVGDEIWDDLNFLNDPLAPVSVPDPTTPGYGGPLATTDVVPPSDQSRRVASDTSGATWQPDHDAMSGREQRARALGAWPDLGSYAWTIDGEKSESSYPWLGGFPQTGIQTPSIMHFLEMRSAEGSDHRIETIGMSFAGAPIVLIGQTDSVAWTSTTAQLKTDDFYIEELVLEDADALRYNDEGSPAPLSKRTEIIRHTDGSTTPIVAWRSHERGGNGGSRTIEDFRGDAEGTVDAAAPLSLTDAGAFGTDFVGGYVAIVYGTGAGQIREIASANSDTLTLAGGNAWTTTPNVTSAYVAVKPGSEMTAVSRERVYWLEESLTAFGFSRFQRAEDVLDIRAGARLIPSTHNFPAIDNQPYNGVGADLLNSGGNTAYFSSGFSRIRQGAPPTDPRLPLDGTVPSEYVVASGTVESATPNSLTDTGTFTGQDFSPPPMNFRLDNPDQLGSEYIVSITSGAGYKQTRRIASNDADTLTLEADWGVTPQPGDTFEVYEIVAMPEAINPSSAYTANWNNKAATADLGRDFGRQQRVIFILERLAAENSWTREEQRDLNEQLAGLEGKGAFGRYLIPRLRQAVDFQATPDPAVEAVVAALEAHFAAPFHGRGFTDATGSTMIAGEIEFLNELIPNLSGAIYSDEFQGTGITPPGGSLGLAIVQHAIDSAAGDVAGAYSQAYSGDYFNGTPWQDVVYGALSDTVTDLGGIPADIPRPDSTYAHPLAALFPNLVFDPTPIGNRGTYEQIIEAGPTVKGEFIFPLGQSGFIDTDGVPDRHATSMHPVWADWRFVPMLHIAEDLAIDPDGDVDNDGILDGYERWYFGSTSPGAASDADGDGLTLLGEFLAGLDPTVPDTDGNGTSDANEDLDEDGCSNAQETGANPLGGGDRDPLWFWDFFDTPNDANARDGAVTISDVFRVVLHFGETGDRTIDPLSAPTGGYHTAFDRAPAQPGDEAWELQRADGSITISDILLAVLQFGHSCA